jgi:hypothetical protein
MIFFANSKLRNFQFLSIIIGMLAILLPNLVIKTSANPNTNFNTQSNQNIFISEVSFGGSKALNNCKSQIGGEQQENLIESMCNFDKWIELYNPTENAINLNGYRVVVQNGLSEILSGQIAPKSFLVLSNSNYKYQNTQKIEEDFVPQKPVKKEIENETENQTEDQKVKNSFQSSSQKLPNSSQNNSQNLENKTNSSLEEGSTANSTVKSSSISSSFISSPNSSISNILNQKINSESFQTNSIINSIQDLPKNNTNTTSINQNKFFKLTKFHHI